MPLLFLTMMCLFLHGMAPGYWLVALPVLLLLGFMNTLADVHDAGHMLCIKRWWNSVDVPKRDVTRIAPSFLNGIGVLQLRRFVFPWGRIYFVSDWSNVGTIDARSEGTALKRSSDVHSFVRNVLPSLAFAVSGFISARAISVNDSVFRIESPFARIIAFTIAVPLCAVFALTRTRKSSFANGVLFMATWIVGLVRW